MATWTELDQELARWHNAGQEATFWWRDDDTQRPTPALDRLLNLASTYHVPLHLAVIPAHIARDLRPTLEEVPEAWVMQHGLAHINYEPKGLGASEVGDHRPLEDIVADLKQGWEKLVAAQLPRTLPAFAAPWNRMSDAAVSAMPALGYGLVSTSGPRVAQHPVPGILQVNIQLDPIRWKEGPTFRGEERCLNHVVTHLRQRRLGEVDAAEPTGILTHHLDTDEATWAFTEHLLDYLSRSPATRAVTLQELITAEAHHG